MTLREEETACWAAVREHLEKAADQVLEEWWKGDGSLLSAEELSRLADPECLAPYALKVFVKRKAPSVAKEPQRSWSTCPVCGGDGGAKGECYKCGGSGWL